ncbi:hypothetical protein [Prochlorococcus marinus]|nr:hypothetical protein [Prochlorococcus marinus]
MLIQVPVPWLKSRCGSLYSELNVLVAVATKTIMLCMDGTCRSP